MQNFTLLDKIGSGSYSTVYRARDQRTNQTVALKIMKFPYSKGKRLQDMELTALKKFKSNPCVIQLLECFMENDIMYMVFELGGSTLIDYYRNHQGKFTEEQVKLIGFQIALALQDMHRSGYMHRDLKPQNIMIDPQNSKHHSNEELVKLVDFGLCKKWQTDVNTNYVTTRWYRSPELILNLPYGVNIDVFSLGCVMLELYLGYEAFPGKDAIDQLNKVFSVVGTPSIEEWPEGMKHLEEKRIVFPAYEKTDLHSHIAAISQEGVDLIQKMIACNYKDRISSKQAMEHPYFKSLDASLLPEVVQRYIRQTRPPVIQYPLKLNVPANDKLKSGSTDTSTSRKVMPTKRKLELVSNSIQKRLNFHSQHEIAENYKIKVNEPEVTLKTQQQQPNKSFAGSGSSTGQFMHSHSTTHAKKKLNLTLLDHFNSIASVRNNTLANIHSSEVEEEEPKSRQKSQSKDQLTNRQQLYKFLVAFDKGTRLGDTSHCQSFTK